MKYRVTTGEQDFEIEIDCNHLVRVNGRPLYVEFEQIAGLPAYSLSTDEGGYVVFVEEKPGAYRVEIQGKVFPVSVELQRPRLPIQPDLESSGSQECHCITAPLAGQVASLAVGVGDQVEAGQTVATLESMKMQMEIKAPHAATVEILHVEPGQEVRQGQELATLRPAPRPSTETSAQ